MPIRKIDDPRWPSARLDFRPCLHHEHNPPAHVVLEPGTYEYECPSCGQKTTFTVGAVW